MSKKIRSVIVDDETKSIGSLTKLLDKYVPEVEICGTASSVKEATETINKLKPELVFLDISMPDGNGFDVLENVSYKKFEVIFITAYDRYAVKAFEFSAIHYLLKPISYIELQKAVGRYEQIKNEDGFEEKINILRESMGSKPQKIILPTSEGFNIIDLDKIIRCEADSNYTIFYFADGNKEIVSKSLNNFEKLLSDIHFERVHNKHLINLKHVKKYVKGKAGYVIMNDSEHVYISETRRKSFVDALKKFAKSL